MSKWLCWATKTHQNLKYYEVKTNTVIYLGFLIATLFISCADQEEEWINLLDEQHADQWRGFKGETLPPGWSVDDGMLYFDTDLKLEQDYEGGNDVVYGGREFEHFELSLEWKIPEGGNSGIFYHVNEEYDAPSGVSPEYQLIDDENYADIHDLVGYNSQFGAEHPEQLQDWQMTGANYAMHTVDTDDKVLHPAGEWNSSRIVVAPERTEHWLNGVKLLSFVPGSDDWKKRKNSGKWDKYPDYGKFNKGYIALQDHGSALWFRNIKVKPLE